MTLAGRPFLLTGAAIRFRYLQPGLAVILAGVAAKLLLAEIYQVPAWASPAFIAVVLAAVAALSIRDHSRAARAPAHASQERSDVPPPAESAPGSAGVPAAGNDAGHLPGSGDGQLVVTVAAVGEPSAWR